MRPDQQLRILRKIWGRGAKGYVFLPWIEQHAARSSKRKAAWTEGRAFAWPAEADKVKQHLERHKDDDLYFAPMVFNGKERRTEYAATHNRLWADLDEVDPESIPERLKPTFAWETSPGRYAGVWVMNTPREGATNPGRENHRLTKYLGADPSGWDTTQLLRVPGSANNKPNKPAGTRGRMVWGDRENHDWDEFDALPEIKGVSSLDIDALSEELLEGIDRHAVWAKVRLKVNKQVREYMRMKDDGGLDRSDILWQIERELADAGCSLAEIVAIVRPTPWNKYEGRADELNRLMTEATKALAAVADKDDVLEAEEDDIERPAGLVSFQDDDAFIEAKRPNWLVKDFWIDGGVGFIAGAPKSMKSWFALHLAFAVSTRTDYWGHSVTRARNVLYIQQEDDIATVKQRLGIIVDSQAPEYHWSGILSYDKASQQITHAPPKRTPRMLSLVVQSGFTASNEAWQVWLDEMVAKHDIGMVIMDTLMTVAGGIDVDKATEIKPQMLDPLKVIARRHNCAMVLVHHNTKGGQAQRGAMNMAGSGQIHAWADCGMYVHNREGNELKVELETKFGANRTTHISLASLDLEHDEEIGRPLWLPREIIKEEDGTGLHTGPARDSGRGRRRANGELRGNETRKDRTAAVTERVRAFKVEHPDASVRTIAAALEMSVGSVSNHLRKIRDEG